MKLMVMNSEVSCGICSRLTAINKMTNDGLSVKTYAIGDLVELSLFAPDEMTADDRLKYGPDFPLLVEDIMTNFVKINHTEWFKEIYIVPESNGMVLVVQ